MQGNRLFTSLQAACLSDSFGRASIIDIIYDHPRGITFRGIKMFEDRGRKRLYENIPPKFHRIRKEQLERFLKDLKTAHLVTEENGQFNLVWWFRDFLDGVMRRARTEHPELFTQQKKG